MVTEGDISIIMTRIFDKLDSFEDKIDKICERLTKLEMSVKDHYNDIEVAELVVYNVSGRQCTN